MIGLDPLGAASAASRPEWREGGKHGLRHRVVDLHGADVEAVDAATIRDRLAGAVITREAVRPV